MSSEEFPLSEQTRQIIGCAIEVSNVLGHGFHEKPYENAMVIELGLHGIPVVQQPSFPIKYKEVKVGEYRPDLICFDAVVVDTKAIDRISDHELGQMLNYLRISQLSVGLIINFRYAKLEFKRAVL